MSEFRELSQKFYVGKERERFHTTKTQGRTSGLLAKSSPGAGFTTPCTIIYVCITNTGTLPSARTSDV